MTAGNSYRDISRGETLKKTPLYHWHQARGAKMVPFAGFDMPVQYAGGILREHEHTRNAASLFDVSHMGQIEISGPNACEELERLVPLNLEILSLSEMAYTVLPNEQGGCVDDLIVTRRNRDNFLLVVNAGSKGRVLEHLSNELETSPMHILNDQALLALQGPGALNALLGIFPTEIADLDFMNGMLVKYQQMECFLSRSGYTGEDGFELAVASLHAPRYADILAELPGVEPAGLGARDSLRLEAGLCLYGHELNETTTLVEAGLGWTVSPSRRKGGKKEGGFIGSDVILAQLEDGAPRQRVGLKVQGKAPIREGASLYDSSGQSVGEVTSGTFGPSLGVPIAMAYVDAACSGVGSKLNTELRGKTIELEVVALPFVKHQYHHRG